MTNNGNLKEGNTKSEVKNATGVTKAKPPAPGPRLPISDLKALSDKHGFDQVIMMTWERGTGTENVATYGKTQADCEMAAAGGNLMKKTLGWPEDKWNEKPARQKSREKLQRENEELKELLSNFTRHMHNPVMDDNINLAKFVAYTVLAEKHLNVE